MEAFCRKWLVAELALGSRSQTADDPLGLYVRFQPRADWSLLDRIRMQEELRSMCGQPVTLHNRHSVELRKHGQHSKARLLYDA